MRFHALGSFAVSELSERRLPPLRSVLPLGRSMRVTSSMIAIAVLLSACRQSPDALLASFETSVQSAASAEDIVAWGDSMRTNAAGTSLPPSTLPVWARQVPDLSSAGIGIDVHSGDRIVTLTAGGSFGAWGMAIGPRNYESSLGRLRREWTNGIWFFRQ